MKTENVGILSMTDRQMVFHFTMHGDEHLTQIYMRKVAREMGFVDPAPGHFKVEVLDCEPNLIYVIDEGADNGTRTQYI